MQLEKLKNFGHLNVFFCEVKKISDAYFSLIEPSDVTTSS